MIHTYTSIYLCCRHYAQLKREKFFVINPLQPHDMTTPI